MQIKCFPAFPWAFQSTQGSGSRRRFLQILPRPFFSFPLFIYTSSLNNSHCLLFSPNVPQKRPTMSDCSHQMDSWMQQVGQMARRPVWCCLLRHGLPFFPGTLSSSEHWVVCSLGVGWKWGAGKSLICIPRGIINYQRPSSSLPPTSSNPGYFTLLLCEWVY